MTSPYQKYQNYKLTTHPDRSKIQNAVDYANKSSLKTKTSTSSPKTSTPPRSPSPKHKLSQIFHFQIDFPTSLQI